MDEYITLQQAAERAGYRDAAALRIAARKGKLRTVKPSRTLHMTTQVWLDDYLAHVRPGNYKRGLPKGLAAGGDEAREDPA